MSPFPSVPAILCILDGWGIAVPSETNGISTAHTPTWDRFMRDYPHGQLQASELYVGLPQGQMGNSEVGHMTIGAGRVIMQDLPRIDLSLENGTLVSNPHFIHFLKALKDSGGTCHLLGLLSPGGVHSHQSHMESLVKMLKEQGIPLNIHAFLDGRDTPPQSAHEFVSSFLTNTQMPLSTVGGRYFAMDRDKRWDRIEKAYRALVFGDAPQITDPLLFLKDQYKQGIGDEFIPPHCVGNYAGMKEGDGLFMVNFRADRVRQLLHALLLPGFTEFDRGHIPPFAATLAMGEYAAELTPFIPPLFPKEPPAASLGSIVASAGLNQLRIAETEKYAHVTFFLNGGQEDVFPGEDRILVPSPSVATYDLKPEMSAAEVTDKVVEAIDSRQYGLIVINYANPDMVGHTGIPEAIQKAVETVDTCLGRLEDAAQKAGYALLITADHGNVEQTIDEITGVSHTAHTCNPVPIVLVNGPKTIEHIADGQLSDLAPTILTLLGLTIPSEMTGKSLLRENESYGIG